MTGLEHWKMGEVAAEVVDAGGEVLEGLVGHGDCGGEFVVSLSVESRNLESRVRLAIRS